MAEGTVIDPNANPGGAPAGGDHWSATLPEDLRPWAAGMGLDKLPERDALAKVLPMYRGAEQKLGVPADQVLRLPGKDAKPEDWRAVWSKLGAPEKPEGYDFGEALKDDKIAASFRAKAHELGIPAGHAKAMVEWFTGETGAMHETENAAWDARFDKEVGEMQTEWGDDFPKHKDLANRVLKTMGFTHEEQQALERALGPKALLQRFSKFGGALGEHRFAGGEGQQQFSMSAEQARQRIADLNKDSAWMASYIGGDADKKAEWTRLHQIAFPEQQAA